MKIAVKTCFLIFLSFSATLLWTACQTTKKQEESPSLHERMSFPRDLLERAKDSSVNIEYVLGRNHYRLLALSRGASVSMTTYLEKEVIQTGMIDADQYPGFLQNASEFVSHLQENSPEDPFCRSPFMIAVRIGKKSQTSKGCRSKDNGALSKLIKEGEFLLYSRR